MSGIDITDEVTSSQLEALAGGELLQAEVSFTKLATTFIHKCVVVVVIVVVVVLIAVGCVL